MKKTLKTMIRFRFFILGVSAFIISFFLSHPTHAEVSRYVCAAKVDCGSPGLPSTQDLPAENTPTVRSADPESAKAQCLNQYSSSYQRLTKSFAPAKGCTVASEALKTTRKTHRAPASR